MPLEFHETLPTIHQLTVLLVKEAMKRSLGNLDKAAGMLGISRQTILKYVMQEFNRI
jgi:DNA-binding protein Fis